MRYRFLIPLFRSRHSPEFTARGVANGVFWGLTPTVGLQTAEIVATWLVAKKVAGADSSLVQALVWVWVNNPLTMLPLYYVFYVTGTWLTGAGAGGSYAMFLEIWDAPGLSWTDRLTGATAAIGLPILVGCVPYALAGSVLSYCWALGVMRRRRKQGG